MKKFIVGLTVVASLAFAGATSAASPGTAKPYGTCNSYKHVMTAGTNFRFNQNRSPNGAYLRVRYAYVRVNSGKQAIWSWNYIGPLNAGLVRPNVHPEQGYLRGPYFTVIVDNRLDQRNLPVNRYHWKSRSAVEAWNGSSWESNGWTATPGYDLWNNYGWQGVFSDCLVSLTV